MGEEGQWGGRKEETQETSQDECNANRKDRWELVRALHLDMAVDNDLFRRTCIFSCSSVSSREGEDRLYQGFENQD